MLNPESEPSPYVGRREALILDVTECAAYEDIAVDILTAEPVRDIPVPGAGYTFGGLQIALANGDFEALHQRNERVLWLHFSGSVQQGLTLLESTMSSALAHLRQIA